MRRLKWRRKRFHNRFLNTTTTKKVEKFFFPLPLIGFESFFVFPRTAVKEENHFHSQCERKTLFFFARVYFRMKAASAKEITSHGCEKYLLKIYNTHLASRINENVNIAAFLFTKNKKKTCWGLFAWTDVIWRVTVWTFEFAGRLEVWLIFKVKRRLLKTIKNFRLLLFLPKLKNLTIFTRICETSKDKVLFYFLRIIPELTIIDRGLMNLQLKWVFLKLDNK